jgi:hypothetical protein
VISAGCGKGNLFGRHDRQDRQPGLGADTGDSGQHLEAVALLLRCKAVEGDIVLGHIHDGIDGALFADRGQSLAGGGGDLHEIADPAAADHNGIQRFFDDFSG